MTAQNPTPETNAVRAPRRGLRRWSWLMLALPLMLGGVAYNAANAYAFPGHGGRRQCTSGCRRGWIAS